MYAHVEKFFGNLSKNFLKTWKICWCRFGVQLRFLRFRIFLDATLVFLAGVRKSKMGNGGHSLDCERASLLKADKQFFQFVVKTLAEKTF